VRPAERLPTQLTRTDVGPLPVWALVAVGAALAGWSAAPPRPVWLAALASAPVLAVLAWRGRRPAVATVAVALVLTGAAGARVDLRTGGPLDRLARASGTAHMTATVVLEPRPSARGWWTLVRVQRVGPIPTRERALWRGDGPPPVLGSRWAGRASARPLGGDGFDAYLARLHAGVRLDPVVGDAPGESAWVRAGPPGPLASSSERVRERIRSAAARHLADGPAGLAVGLVTGDTRLLPEADAQAMRDTGLTHLTAVSGSNLAITVAAALAVAAVLRVGARGRRWMVGVTVLGFAYLTRLEPSVVRAATMAGVVLLASARGVPRHPAHALAGAVLVMVAVDPAVAGSLGMVLSAVATSGVLVVAPAVRERLAWLPDRVADLLAVTLGAQFAVAPLLLSVDGEVPMSSLPANLIAVPAAAIASLLVGIASVVAIVSVPAAGVLVWCAGPALAVVLAAAHGLRFAGGVVSLARPVTVIASVGAIAWMVAGSGSRLRRAGGWVAVGAAVLLAVPTIAARAPVHELTVTAIDVGQGDAILIDSPGATVLTDAGGDGRAARWLRSRGRRDLDLVIVSHPHADHVDGLPEVLLQGDVSALWFRPVPTELDSVTAFRTLAAERGIPVHTPHSGQVATVGDLRIEILGPPPGRPYRWADSEPNETSLVVRVTWRGRSALLTGDAELAAQQALLAAPGRLRAGVLKVPHHGAGTTSPGFLAATRARAALIPVGADNRYGHPHPRTLRTLADLGMTIHRTDEAGTVRVVVPPVGPELTAPRQLGGVQPGAWVGSRHDRSRLPARRRRRPAAPSRAAASCRATPKRRPRARGRDLRRPGDRAPPRAADPVVVRWAAVRGPPRCRGVVR
jgi:competence protein ComEC